MCEASEGAAVSFHGKEDSDALHHKKHVVMWLTTRWRATRCCGTKKTTIPCNYDGGLNSYLAISLQLISYMNICMSVCVNASASTCR